MAHKKRRIVSVLFSEPKIPQPGETASAAGVQYCFSALQRAENSSKMRSRQARTASSGFSALQRAENSSTNLTKCHSRSSIIVSVLFSEPKIPQRVIVVKQQRVNAPFQCSSASRKFLNPGSTPRYAANSSGFSALQRAENSSTMNSSLFAHRRCGFSALQRAENSSTRSWNNLQFAELHVSVLFSEPKIPQLVEIAVELRNRDHVSVLFSEPKIPQYDDLYAACDGKKVSVLFSEPKIPQRCE